MRPILVSAVLTLLAASPAHALTIPFPQRDGSLTPYTFELGYPLMTLVYDTLLWRDASGVPRPWLARSVATSGGGRRVVVRLRSGARWHDGRPVTARDVAFTVDYMRTRPHPRFTPQLQDVREVEAADRQTVVFRLRRPSPGFTDQPLADMPILPAHLWGGLSSSAAAPAGLPVGSGPYRMTARRADGGWRFTADRSYFLGRPVVDRIEVPIERDAERMLRSLVRREVDMVPVPIPPEREGEVDGLGLRVARGPLYGATVLLLNLRIAPFDEREARRGVSAALDPGRVAGSAVAAERGIVHPDSRWAPGRAEPPAPRRLAGLEVPVLAPANDPAKLRIARRVARSLTSAGARARVVTVSARELAARVGEDGARPDFTAAVWSLSPLSSYDPAFLAAEFGAGEALNRSGYASAAFDAAARAHDIPAMLDRLAQDVPVVPLAFPRGIFAHRPAVHDAWIYVKGSGILDKRSFLEQEAPVQRTEPAQPARSVPAERAAIGPIGIVALVLLALAGALAVVLAFLSRR